MQPPDAKQSSPYLAASNQSLEIIVSTKLQMKLVLTGNLPMRILCCLYWPLLGAHPKSNPRSLPLFWW